MKKTRVWNARPYDLVTQKTSDQSDETLCRMVSVILSEQGIMMGDNAVRNLANEISRSDAWEVFDELLKIAMAGDLDELKKPTTPTMHSDGGIVRVRD